MKVASFLSVSAPLLGVAHAVALHHAAENVVADALLAAKRATAQAPDGYTPRAVDCPSERPSIRSASSLSPQESAWLERRRNNTISPMREFLNRVNITGFDVDSYLDGAADNATALPNIGITFSGGGWRAMLNGAGALAAFDSRTPGSTGSGNIGGVLQAATYIVGLSGGNWLTGSIYANNFTSVQAIIDSNGDDSGSLWDFSNTILEGPATSRVQLLSTADYWTNLISDVDDKRDAGFNTSITDYWGRGLSYYLVNATDGGPGYTFSSIADDPDFSNGNAPMPISVSDGRYPGETLVSLNTTNYEFNPFEMGTWDPTVFGFAPLRYLGSRFSAGRLLQNDSCIRGFDNIGFVMGTSSSLFNAIITNLNGTDAPQIAIDAVRAILTGLSDNSDDIADYSPNPFYFWNNQTNDGSHTERLTLVDGGEDGQNIGFSPIIEPRRNVDIIFAVDSSADIPEGGPSSSFWPNGTSMVATYTRYANGDGIANGTLFPAVPDINTFVNQGLNTRPTFFGCNSSAEVNARTPLVVYIPNHPYVYNSNVSTFQLSYNTSERNAIINNGYDVATLGNGTVDDQWPTCVGCAILARSLERTGTDVPDVCQTCMRNYCWDGTRNSSTPAPYNPTLVLADQAVDVQSAAVGLSVPSLTAAAAALLSIVALAFA